MDGSDELSPPPEIMDAPRRSSLARGKMSSPEMGDRSGADFDMDMDGSPVIGVSPPFKVWLDELSISVSPSQAKSGLRRV